MVNKNSRREGKFIRILLKQITYPQKCRISSTSVETLISIIRDFTIKIISEAFHLLEIKNMKTLTAREVQVSVRLLFSGELAKHAILQGMLAVDRYKNSGIPGLVIKHSFLKSKVKQMNFNYRISNDSMVYLSAVIEYLLFELLDISIGGAKFYKSLIYPKYINITIQNDLELLKLFGNKYIIPQGGVFPTNINQTEKSTISSESCPSISLDSNPAPSDS